jgi:DNA-binding PadR family transcriptional regulator
MMSLRYLALGLLTQQPMAGYDIKRRLKPLAWLIGSPSFGNLYPILRSLLQENLVTVEVQLRQDKPPRKIYTITEAGQQALQTWTEQPATPRTTVLKTFVMRLVLAGHFTRSSLIGYLRQRRAQVSDYHTALDASIQELRESTDLEHRLASDYGLAMANAELRWLDDVLIHLSGEPTPEEVQESDRTVDAV